MARKYISSEIAILAFVPSTKSKPILWANEKASWNVVTDSGRNSPIKRWTRDNASSLFSNWLANKLEGTWISRLSNASLIATCRCSRVWPSDFGDISHYSAGSLFQRLLCVEIPCASYVASRSRLVFPVALSP